MDGVHSVLFIGWVIFFVFWFVTSLITRSKTKRREASRSFFFHWIALLTVSFLLLVYRAPFLPAFSLRLLPSSPALNIIGTTIAFAALGFAMWARVHLGRYWSASIAIKESHELVRGGPFQIVRTPHLYWLAVRNSWDSNSNRRSARDCRSRPCSGRHIPEDKSGRESLD